MVLVSMGRLSRERSARSSIYVYGPLLIRKGAFFCIEGGSMTLVIAHRGASAYAPENTMPAFELAIEQQADMLELDVQRTADGALVIFHDATTERWDGQKRRV